MFRIKPDEVQPEVPVEQPQLPVEQPQIPVEEPTVPMEDDLLDPALVVYRGPQEGPFQCSNCIYFTGANTCVQVAGEIDPMGLCNLFTTMSGPAEEVAEPLPVEPEVPVEEEMVE
jgi:hypothetical protein